MVFRAISTEYKLTTMHKLEERGGGMTIIKNFKMPDSCNCCPCSITMESLVIDNFPYDLCVLTEEEVSFYDSSRHERCPLVEVEG